MKIAWRISLSFSTILALFCLLGLWSYVILGQIGRYIADTQLKGIPAREMAMDMHSVAQQAVQDVEVSGRSGSDAKVAEIASLRSNFKARLTALTGLASDHAALVKIGTQFDAAMDAGQAYIDASVAHKPEAAKLGEAFESAAEDLDGALNERSLAATQAIDESLDTVAKKITRYLRVFAFSILVCLALTLTMLFSLRRIVEPLHLAASKLEELAAGSSDLTLRLPVLSRDEAGRLSGAFNRFLDSLAGLVTRIQGASGQLSRSSASLREITSQSSATVDHTVEQMARIEETAGDVALSTQSAAASAREVVGKAQQGARLANDVAERITTAQGSVQQAAQLIDRLGKSSAEIGKIVDVISKIADQTNLLSLNAAIEAARAGESGRGFAVVADEIRKLAESTADNAKQVDALARGIQEQTQQAVEAADAGNRGVADSCRLIVDATLLFSSINEEVTRLTERMTDAATRTESVASSAKEVTDAARDQSAAIARVAQNAEQLNAVVDQLKALAGQFRTTGGTAT